MGKRGPKRQDPKEHLLSHRNIVNNCWEYTGFRSNLGYGKFGIGRDKQLFTHRLAYQIFVGPIPEGIFVCHKCDNPPCFNPQHLFLGTQYDNLRDALAKGRCRNKVFCGENHGQCKLTDEQVRQIREAYAVGNTSHRKLSAKFKVSNSHIGRILSGENRAFLKLEDMECIKSPQTL